MAGIWWHVKADGARVLVEHGPYDDDGMGAPVARVAVGLDSACELAIGLVHAALEVDTARTQEMMLRLWLADDDEPVGPPPVRRTPDEVREIVEGEYLRPLVDEP